MKYYLFDSKQNKYVAKSNEIEEGYFLTEDESRAYRFLENQIDLAWHTAYKCAWLGLGQFFVHGD